MFQKLRSAENIKFMKETASFHSKILAVMYGFLLIIIIIYLVVTSLIYLELDSKKILEAIPFVPAFIILALNLGMAVFYFFQKDVTKAISSIILAGAMFIVACIFIAALLVSMAVLGAIFKFFAWVF